LTGLLLLTGAASWLGSSLLLSGLRRFARTPLLTRIRPYAAPGSLAQQPAGLFSADSFGEVLQPVAEVAGAHLARAAGVSESLARRLERVHAHQQPAEFRLRQLGWSVACFGAAGAASVAVRLPPAVGLLLLLGAPLLAFLVLEQRLARASAVWQRQLFAELPVVSEQLGMLLSAGFSPGAALQRVAARGRGCSSQDLQRVYSRIRQGLSQDAALKEWAAVAQVDGVHRLVALLALGGDASDLGRLIAEEARSLRRDAHRQLLETIERRSQQVWVPVTVATLVPGVIFLAVPFIEALRLFSGA
jgi:Flp pilus assembly protein TadB